MADFEVKLGTYALGTETALDTIKVLTSRRISQFPIIRDDNTIIPKGQQKPLSINFTGTVTGSDWTSLRTAIGDLRNAIQTDKRDLTLDDERYAHIVSKNFDYSFITTDFANFNIKFTAELPYWLASVAESDIRGPVSGSTYIITNDGDVRVPLKIGVTASTSGAADDLQVENKTSGSLCKFRGTLTSTEYLIIDTGYVNNNKPQFVVELEGVSAMSAFEGDFIWLESGDNEIEFTGAEDSTVSLFWRKGFMS